MHGHNITRRTLHRRDSRLHRRPGVSPRLLRLGKAAVQPDAQAMSIGWILFWALEALGAAVLLVTRFKNKQPTSMDVAMGDEIGNAVIALLMLAVAAIGAIVFAWHHFRFSLVNWLKSYLQDFPTHPATVATGLTLFFLFGVVAWYFVRVALPAATTTGYGRCLRRLASQLSEESGSGRLT